MAPERWLILDPICGDVTLREKHLQIAKARAHVAKVIHSQRKRRKLNALTEPSQDCQILVHVERQDHSEGERETDETPSPRVIVDNGRTDPFQVWSVHIRENEHQLVDVYINVFVREFYGRPSNPAGFNWFREIVFKLGMEHPVVFRCGVLGIASHMQARFQGHVETMVQDVQSLHLIRSHFEASPNDCSDSAIMMCIFRSLFDDFQGNLIASWTHLRAATQMIRQRGGPEAFRDNALIASVANCYAYRMRGYVQGAMLAHMKYPISESPHTDWPSIDTYEVALVREELIQFLYAVEKLTLSQRNAWQSRRRTFFDRNSVFHQAMSSPYKVFGSFPSLQNHTMFGLSILLHFNAALLDFQHDQDLCELFFHDLDTRIKETKLDAGIRLESLAQFLIYPTPNSRLRPAQFDRLWKVGRLLQVAKRLCAKSFHQLWETLEAYLTFDEPPQSIFEWEDDLRDEILQAPPTKLVSGILQEASPRQEVDYIEVCF